MTGLLGTAILGGPLAVVLAGCALFAFRAIARERWMGRDAALLRTDLDGRPRAGRDGYTVTAGVLHDAEDPDRLFYTMMRDLRETGRARARLGGDLVLARRHRSDILWHRLDLPEELGGPGPDGAVPFGRLNLAEDGTIARMNDWVRDRSDQPRRIEDLLLDLPLGEGSLHRLVHDPAQLVRAHLATDDGGTVWLLPSSAAEATRTSADRYLMQLPIALARVDAKGRVEIANPSAQRLVGPELAPGADLSQLMEGLAQSVRARIEEVARTGRAARPEIARLSAGDAERFLQVSLSPMVQDDERSILVVMSDATELKTLEAQFVQSQKMQAVGQLAGGVAHDFNNLLTALSGHCDLLLLRNGPGDRDYLDLMQIRQNANRAAALVGQLLAFSRKQTLQPKVLDLAEVLEDLSHLLNRLIGEKVTLDLSAEDNLPPIRADLRQIEQVVMNLVVNARDAMQDGGTVRVSAELHTLREELRRDRAIVAPGDWLVIEVADTGAGIPERHMGKIFDPFYTTKRQGEGTGLGLSTAYGIVKQTGGFIFVDSVPGQGTTFSLYFPRHVPSAEESPATARPPGQDEPTDMLGSGTVLLVEDEAPVRAFAARALQLRGYTVLEAASGEEALELLEDRPRVDIVVSDVIMPGLDGPSWVAEARRDYPDLEVIFVSGYAEDVFDAELERPANSTFLAKPFSLNDLSLQVKRSMDAARSRGAAADAEVIES
ncbi:ATP-binding protein [Roseobacter sp. HKCCA0434]|uniref:ATP-binding response regulator n=1 Tax=Roseobacter sp. HKCCA0434 TaxID=3079297 RepID=UPI002905C0F1|nr:ATP-binding protein [Roseobacter sp. HKCCA0434]